jgi:hypothetical protein
MKRALLTGMVIATVVGATVAEAAIKKGTFTGKTSAADPVGFKVGKRGKVYSFYYEGVTLKCTDGDSFDTPTGTPKPDQPGRVQTPSKVRFKVTSKGKWGIQARNTKTGFGWDVDAKFRSKGERSTGTLSVFATFNEQNQQDPNGTIRCESDELSWSAKRR